MGRTVVVILGGGRGTRLRPLTQRRAKPAVPFGGKYRLIDIPLSNAINSGLKNVFVLTQFRSASLNAHIARTYRFDIFTRGHVEVLAAEQTECPDRDWYQGTADAVRKHLRRLVRPDIEAVLVLAGDHLYRMDYRRLLATHHESGADITVSALPVVREACAGFGVMRTDGDGRIRSFVEKPGPEVDLAPFEVEGPGGERRYLASMGIYVFRPEALDRALRDTPYTDFGGEVIPAMLEPMRVVAHRFDGYWADIGTIASLFDASLALTRPDAPFRLWDPDAPIYTRPRFLPASRFADAHVVDSLVADGCLVERADLSRSVVGIRSRIQAGAVLAECVLMGADLYETDEVRAANRRRGVPDIGVGRGAVIERAIIDKNARIGEGAVVRGHPGRPEVHTESWSVVDGIVVVPKNAVIPPGTVV